MIYALIAVIWPRRSFRNYLSMRRSGYPMGFSLYGAVVYAGQGETVRPDDLFVSEMHDMWGTGENWLVGYKGD